MKKGVKGGSPVEEQVKGLVEDYVRGERTAEEVREEVASRADLAGLISECLGCFSFPHEILEAVDLSPFDAELRFERPLSITREGMIRNLRLARDGKLEPGALCDWVTDWFSWYVAEQPDDGVVLELAGDLMPGPERVEEVVASDELFELFLWHLESTDASMADSCTVGLAVSEHRDELASLLRAWLNDETDEDDVRRHVARVLGEERESFPTFEDDYVEAARMLRDRPQAYEAIDAFLRSLARNPDPLSCVEM